MMFQKFLGKIPKFKSTHVRALMDDKIAFTKH